MHASRVILMITLLAMPSVSLRSAPDPEVSADLPLPEEVFPELKDILRQALAQSPRMITRNFELIEATHELGATRARQYPRAGVFGMYFYQRDDRVDRPEPSLGEKFYYDVRVTQPVFHWGALRDETERARIQAKIEEADYLEAYRLLALSVRRQYLGLIVRKAVRVRAQAAYDRQVRRVEMQKVRVASGEAPSSVLQPEELVLRERQVDLERATYDFENALRTFRRTTGVSDFGAERVPGEIPKIEVGGEEAVLDLRRNFVEKGDLQEAFRLRKALFSLQREQLREKITRRDLWPKFDFQAGLTQNEISYTENIGDRVGVTSLFAGLRVTWNIFDSRATRERMLASRARQRRLEQEIRNLEQELRDEALAAADELRIFGMAMRNADQRLVMQVSGRKMAEENFNRGLATEEHVAAAAYSEQVARVNAFIGRSSYLEGVANFLSAVNADPIVLEVMPKILNR